MCDIGFLRHLPKIKFCSGIFHCCLYTDRMTRKPGDVIGYSDTPERIYGPYDRVEKPAEISQTGDKGYRLEDVYDKKISMETFVAQLSDEDLIMLFRGEGMCSPKVTPGTAAAFAGLTPSLRKFRIPAE